MNVPPYIVGQGEFAQENYQEELSQTLFDNFSDNGLVVPSILDADLRTNAVEWPDGTTATPAVHMPNGTMWFVTDHIPPVYVGKISGALVQFTTAAYP